MPTQYDYALLSQKAYSPPQQSFSSKGKKIWTVKKTYSNGFNAVLFVSNEDEAVLSFRGTVTTSVSDLFNDTIILTGNPPVQAVVAIGTVKSIRSQYPKLTLTGHSLGGAIAILIANQLDIEAYTFNAPAVQNECIEFSVIEQVLSRSAKVGKMLQTMNNCLANPKIKNTRIVGDPVSSYLTTGQQVGDTVELDPQSCSSLDLLCKHSIDGIVNRINQVQ